MVGSSAVAGWIAQAAFWVLLLRGFARGELSLRRSLVFLLLWVVGLVGLPYLPYGPALFSPYVAALAVSLVLTVFKRDVWLW
jgi:hypothetical protein